MSQPKAMHAYRQTQKVGGDARSSEANALYAAALRIRDTAAAPGRDGLSDVLFTNLRLWNTLVADMMRPENPLPAEIKANLYKLFLFVDKQTVALLNGQVDNVESLVSVNMEIARGLHTKPPAEEGDTVIAAPERQSIAIQG